MRWQRYGFIFLAFYAIFLTGGYALNIPEIRYFNHVFFTVLAVSWLGWRWYKNKGLPSTPLNVPLLAMLILGFVAVIFSFSSRMSLEHMWQPLIYATMFLFIANAFQRAQERLVMETVFLIAVTVIFLSFIQITSAFFGLGFIRASGQGWINFLGANVPLPWQSDMRIFLPLGVSTQVAGFVVPLIIICLTWALSASKKSYRTILWILTALLGFILILTFSRGGLIAVTLGLASFFVLRSVQSSRVDNLLTRRNLIIVTSLFSLAVAVSLFVFAVGSQGGRQSGDSVRMDLWRSAVNMTSDHPLTGVGIGQYGHALREYRQLETARDRLATAHNVYLNTIAENGLLALIIGGWVAFVVLRSWWYLRKQAQPHSARYVRLNGMLAALIAFAAHNLFDTLTTFAAMSIFSLMMVYCTVQPAKSRLDPVESYPRWTSLVAALILLIYGIWFVTFVDPAQRHFQNSQSGEYDQLLEAQQAIAFDPSLNLYHLQLAYLTGEQAINDSTPENLMTVINLYEDAIDLEPTWDIGMMNLATLYELQGDLGQAQEWLDRARNISLSSPANLHWARIAEQTGDATNEDIVAAYVQGIRTMSYLPLSDFWTETDLREEALRTYMAQITVNRQYRVAQVHFPDELAGLVPETPQTAGEWWVVGEYALTIEDDTETAIQAFTEAIQLVNNRGDFYASRARAVGQSDIESAERDLEIAQFLGTRNEYPNAIRANLATNSDDIETYRRAAVPLTLISQEFEGVVFNGRRANFILYPSVRFVGRGDSVLKVWYDLATDYEAVGDIDSAIEVYEALALIAPEDERPIQALGRLNQ